MQTDVSYYQNKKEFRLFVTKSYSDLVQLKKEGNQASFNTLVIKIMPQIRQYVNTQLNTAIKKGHFSKNKFKADDIIDQLFIEIYDHIEEVKQEKDFYLWLFKKTNNLLEDITVEEEFDEFFFKNIDDYTRPEWDEMQEKYSTDGGGDLLLIEELDDQSYNHNDYTLNHVFIENDENDWIKKIDKDLSTKDINNHIEMMLYNMPLEMRIVYQLSTTQHLSLDEIAQIRNNTLIDVQQLLKDAKKALQVSFINRYPVQ
ncbi:RNA polymerase sigma factor [uncultured Winogradskyella sp.]|uniref:RNA polymerase sigma factor n=1 Tax=uncultured Winogradskyella sp. TaxID=395353 RepID=UPI0026208573|nr:sigma-70 family RNA polymerase sigma factor [uncultured Winogradskyella sp.]